MLEELHATRKAMVDMAIAGQRYQRAAKTWIDRYYTWHHGEYAAYPSRRFVNIMQWM
jgi:hypothetical protein